MTYRRYLHDFWTAELSARCGEIERRGSGNPLVTGLAYNSREVEAGFIFFALRGLHSDGHDYIPQAIERGAAVIIGEAEDTGQWTADGAPLFIRVQDSRFAMSPVAAAFYGEPSRRLRVIGVTGTEGKSTTVSLIFQLLRIMGAKCGFISTVEYSVDGETLPNPEHQTTPEATLIHRRLAEMLDAGAEYAVLESSSHGLSPRTNRLGDVAFVAAVLTNVTHEHLEFHGTWEQYRHDKANLFRALDAAPQAFGVVNAADPSADYFARATKKPVYFFNGGNSPPAAATPHYHVENIESSASGNSCEIVCDEGRIAVEDNLPGAFNTGNMLACLIVVSKLLEKPLAELCPLAGRLRPVRGRMTAIPGAPFEILVDYAHTPSSFTAIFPPLRKRLDASGGRIIAVFGSAGERDTQKRPEQGRIAGRWCDIIVLTDEDPRGEDPMTILEEIAAGITGKVRGESLFLIPDRPQAIRRAYALARAGDLVLLLGKGHENSIIYSRGGRTTIRYDEIAEASAALSEAALN